MQKILITIGTVMFLLLFSGGTMSHKAEASTSIKSSVVESQTKEVINTSKNVALDNLLIVAEEYSIPILVVMVTVSAFLALLGIMFKPLKAAAGGILGMGVLFFVLVNYAPQIAGIMISIVDGVMARITGK